MKIKIKTLFISDVHLGTKKSNAEKLLEVFKKYEFENLYIIGDFLDLTSMKNKFYWKDSHTAVIQKVLKFSRKGKHVTYILGNHDYFLRGLIREQNINLGDIEICDNKLHTTISGQKIYICHGDQFDGFVRLHPFLYSIGDWAYEISFKVNKIYNFFRKLFGFQYWSISKFLKNSVKDAISFINDFKKMAIMQIKDLDCNAIMIGHIHTPAIEKIENKTYYNTGDFCESCSYLIEDTNGTISLHYI